MCTSLDMLKESVGTPTLQNRNGRCRLLICWIVFCLTITLAGCRPPAQQKIDLEPCQVGGVLSRCGTLSVFENRSAGTGRKIDIHVAVIPAKDANPAPDPIFYLAGGPGGSAIDDANYALRVLKSANRQREIVLVDQRGTGRSNLITCPAPLIGLAPYSEQAVDDLRACISQLDADPAAYTTAWGMDDLDDVRAALGYDKINLYGESYGPVAEQVYLQRHGEHVRTMTLEGVTLIDEPIFERLPQGVQEALDLLVARCQADPQCNSDYPNFPEELAALLDQLEKEPVPLSLTDPSTGRPFEVTRGMLAVGIYNLLRNTESAVLLPVIIHQAYLGDWSSIEQALSAGFDPNAPAPVWKIMNLTILCHEDWAKMRRNEIEKYTPVSFIKYVDVGSLVAAEEVCSVMPRPSKSALHEPLTRSNAPVLLIGNQADPMNPPENIAGAKDHYPNSLTLIAPGQGHGYTGIECRDGILSSFIEKGTTEGLDTRCLEEEKLPAFVH